jgi:hypothetical protein
MLRQAISNQLGHLLQTIEDLEATRAKDYGYQVALTLDERAGYDNIAKSIMHWEGRAKEARSILRMIDDVELRVRTDKCECCNHHEIGTVDLDGKFTALKPGQRILIRRVN